LPLDDTFSALLATTGNNRIGNNTHPRSLKSRTNNGELSSVTRTMLRNRFAEVPLLTMKLGISWYRECTPVWRNWQTQQTQNLPGITPREGSIPFTGTKNCIVPYLFVSLKAASYRKQGAHTGHRKL
jgi:hypothetical protein